MNTAKKEGDRSHAKDRGTMSAGRDDDMQKGRAAPQRLLRLRHLLLLLLQPLLAPLARVLVRHEIAQALAFTGGGGETGIQVPRLSLYTVP